MYSLIPVVCAQDITALVRALPGSVAQGLIWGIMAIGVFLTFKILDFADLTVDGTMATGGVVTVMLILKGWNPLAAVAVAFVAGMLDATPKHMFWCYIPLLYKFHIKKGGILRAYLMSLAHRMLL